MNTLALHELHAGLGACFTTVNGAETVVDYGDATAEHAALRGSVGVLDLSARSRLCLVGGDRVKFLHGQVTNDVQRLRVGEGCYAALVNAKGRMESDLNLYRLADELLLDFEPGYRDAVVQRLEKYIITEDVQVLDAAPHYGLFSVQGPKAAAAVAQLGLSWDFPPKPLAISAYQDATLGQLYLARHARIGPMLGVPPSGGAASEPPEGGTPNMAGFDLFIPTASLGAVFDKLVAAAKSLGGRACGWTALETARIESGIPRFGQDMDETNLPPEAGLEARAISYSKGCYIGQEVIARIRTYGQVAKTLRGLRLPAGLATLPVKGDKLFAGDKEVGQITSGIPSFALGYVRKEHQVPGATLTLRTGEGDWAVTVVGLP